MSTQKANVNAPEKDLEKFIKFLALKATQVVVQSRLGEKIQTPCNPLATGHDWFNIDIQDHPDVYAETKRALALEPGQSILQRLPLCVEISLKTVDGDQMVLEVWSLDLQPPCSTKQSDKAELIIKNETGKGIVANGSSTTNTTGSEQQMLRSAHTIYNWMGILLKSLLTLSRAIPAYKLSRRQCPDSYGIYYRIYVDRPQIHTLGEGHKNKRIGQLNTIVGVLSMSVAYRVKMTITPTAGHAQNGGGNAIMVKSDHFRPAEATPNQNPIAALATKKGTFGLNGERKVIDIDKPLRLGAFTDTSKLRQYTEEDFVLPETPPFEWLLRRTRHESGGSTASMESLNRKGDGVSSPQPPCANGDSWKCTNNNNNNPNVLKTHNNNNNVTAFKSFENDEDNQKSTASQSSPIKSLLIPAPITRQNAAPQSHPPEDDNLLKELNFPFASQNSHVNDLAKFYRDCYMAPPLTGLSEIQTELTGSCAVAATTVGSADSSVVDDLSRQLEQFETSLEDYEKLVSQLGLSTSSSTGSRSSGGLQMSN